ncbi:hypothetical protein [Pantoea agglomerans]|jgi:hypothetical protein|uniref:hypothetical protein n=1 Tax=Enterobacter agglomerans TaxID=549 RepID=UPI0016542571|nr:hypothetical protein [Pantoea agglomerans]
MKMNNLLKINKLILRSLFSSSNGKLDSYSVFKKIKVSFPEFIKSINKLEKDGYVTLDGILVTITIAGREHILKDNNASTLSVKNWRETPQSMLGHKLDVDYKYVPSIRLLDPQLQPQEKNNIDIFDILVRG